MEHKFFVLRGHFINKGVLTGGIVGHQVKKSGAKTRSSLSQGLLRETAGSGEEQLGKIRGIRGLLSYLYLVFCVQNFTVEVTS